MPFPAKTRGYLRIPSHPAITVAAAHTAAGAALTCDATLVGVAYQDQLEKAVYAALTAAAESDSWLAGDLSVAGVSTLYILRGGLNFGVHRAVERLTGRPCEVNFLTSERALVDDRAEVTADGYRRYSVVPTELLVVGDIAATGRTLCNALRHLVRDRPTTTFPRRVLIVVVGTVDLAHALEAFLGTAEGRALSAAGTQLSILFLEGAFRLYSGAPPLADHLPHTDFHRAGAVLAPGAWAAAAANPVSLLERCVIYDGGARGFSPRTHLNSILEYWERLSRAINKEPDLLVRHLSIKSGVPRQLPSWQQWRVTADRSAPEHELAEEYEALRGVWHSARDGRILAACTTHLRSIRNKVRITKGVPHDQDN